MGDKLVLKVRQLANLRWNLRQWLIAQVRREVTCDEPIGMSALSLVEVRSLLDYVRNARREGRDTVSCEAVGAHLTLVLIKLLLVLKQALVVVVAQGEARACA